MESELGGGKIYQDRLPSFDTHHDNHAGWIRRRAWLSSDRPKLAEFRARGASEGALPSLYMPNYQPNPVAMASLRSSGDEAQVDVLPVLR